MHPDTSPLHARSLEGRHVFRNFLEDFYAMRRAMHTRHCDIWHPPTDVYETDKQIVIKMSIPGVQPNRVAVQCNGEEIVIAGVRDVPEQRSVVKYHRMEIRNGYFERRIVLNTPCDPQAAVAQYKEGFLYIFIPKAPTMVRHILSIRLTT